MSFSKQQEWALLVATIARDIPGFRVGYKDASPLQRLLARVSFWNDYAKFTTTMYPVVWFQSQEYVDKANLTETLQHEWVHLKDATTLCGKLPFLPAGLNSKLFNLLYIFPQVLAALSLLGFWYAPMFLFLLFLLPLPAPFRMWFELRAYRRSVELLSTTPERQAKVIVDFTDSLTGADYYYAWPIGKAWLRRKLAEPSPYKVQMDMVGQDPWTIT